MLSAFSACMHFRQCQGDGWSSGSNPRQHILVQGFEHGFPQVRRQLRDCRQGPGRSTRSPGRGTACAIHTNFFSCFLVCVVCQSAHIFCVCSQLRGRCSGVLKELWQRCVQASLVHTDLHSKHAVYVLEGKHNAHVDLPDECFVVLGKLDRGRQAGGKHCHFCCHFRWICKPITWRTVASHSTVTD